MEFDFTENVENADIVISESFVKKDVSIVEVIPAIVIAGGMTEDEIRIFISPTDVLKGGAISIFNEFFFLKEESGRKSGIATSVWEKFGEQFIAFQEKKRNIFTNVFTPYNVNRIKSWLTENFFQTFDPKETSYNVSLGYINIVDIIGRMQSERLYSAQKDYKNFLAKSIALIEMVFALYWSEAVRESFSLEY